MATQSKTSSNVKGIDVNGISMIQKNLTAYTQNIAKVNDFDLDIETIQKAIKGSETEKEITAMMNTIKKSLDNYLQTLGDYDEMLNEIKAQYKANDSDNAEFTNIGDYLKKKLEGENSSESNNEPY